MTSTEISKKVRERLEGVHIGCFEGRDKPVILISEHYPGIWLEHVNDSVVYAIMDKSKLYLAENAIDLFLSNQKEDGQLPCYVLDRKRATKEKGWTTIVGYSQIQECTSLARLSLLVYQMNQNVDFLKKAYTCTEKWVKWLEKNRMTTGRGLVEMFVGFDTGHDNSGRLQGMSYEGNYCSDAAKLPPDDVAPIIAVDMNCNFYATLASLSEMASELGLTEEEKTWRAKAKTVKDKLFEICFNKDDCFFYDVDKHGNQRKYLSSTIFHLFMERVLDKNEDKELICQLYERHISNPDEFATPYPYPSMAISDPSCKGHKDFNCWGYYTQGNTALRSALWMEDYGFHKDFERLCRAWIKAWNEHFDEIKLGQELDPVSGIPTKCSEWYSPTMIFYLYAEKYIEEHNSKDLK